FVDEQAGTPRNCRDEGALMEAGTARVQSALVPSDDGVIARALQELDKKLEAWIDAAGTLNERFAILAAAATEEAARPVRSDVSSSHIETLPEAEAPSSPEIIPAAPAAQAIAP